MTIKELMDILKEYKEDLEVCVIDDGWCLPLTVAKLHEGAIALAAEDF